MRRYTYLPHRVVKSSDESERVAEYPSVAGILLASGGLVLLLFYGFMRYLG